MRRDRKARQEIHHLVVRRRVEVGLPEVRGVTDMIVSRMAVAHLPRHLRRMVAVMGATEMTPQMETQRPTPWLRARVRKALLWQGWLGSYLECQRRPTPSK